MIIMFYHYSFLRQLIRLCMPQERDIRGVPLLFLPIMMTCSCRYMTKSRKCIPGIWLSTPTRKKGWHATINQPALYNLLYPPSPLVSSLSCSLFYSNAVLSRYWPAPTSTQNLPLTFSPYSFDQQSFIIRHVQPKKPNSGLCRPWVQAEIDVSSHGSYD